MSWFSAPWLDAPGARRVAAAALAGGLLLALAACGFRPLHYQGEDGEGALADHLAETLVLPLGNQVGQQLHNLLRDRLNPAGQPLEPSYLLSVSLRKSIREVAVLTDETATRAHLVLRADYVLRVAATGAVLFRSESVSVSGYNILTNLFYATRTSEEGAQRRGLRDLADSIRLRLASYFARPQAAGTRG